MAILTHIAGLDMGGMLTRRGAAVMTTDTVIHDTGMIKVGRYPGIGGMALITSVAAGHMIRCLTRRY